MPKSFFHVWTPQQLALLGTVSDRRVGEAIGVSLYAVARKRNSLGITASSPKPRRRIWTKRQLALLGKIPDGQVSAITGACTPAIIALRARLGIAAFVRKEAWRKFTAKEIALLGTKSDGVLARRWGTTTGVISSRRIKLGIPSYRAQNFTMRPFKRASAWTHKELNLLGTQTDEKIGQLIGLGSQVVRLKRISLGIPANRGVGRRNIPAPAKP